MIKKMSLCAKKLLVATALVCTFFGFNNAANAYTNISDAVADTVSPREFTLDADQSVTSALGTMGGAGSTLTIDGSSNKYGINASSVGGINVLSGQTLILKNIGSVTVSGDGKAVTDYTVNKSANGFVSATNGGFINNAGTLTIKDSVFYNNHAAYNNTNGHGGVIANLGASANITEITNATFVGNRADCGAAISNSTNAKIGNITADFINNEGSTGSATGDGVAIFNAANAEIGNINGKFIGNKINVGGGFYGVGVGIYNDNAKIGNVAGEFHNNTVTATSVMGSVIFNDGGAEMGNISGVFENNTSTSSSYTLGGIINNGYTAFSKMGDISADFKNNTISVSNGGAGYIIGAIIETGEGQYSTQGSELGDISGNFENNTATADYGVFGAIYNDAYATIKNITGNFKNNTLTAGNYVYALITNDDGTINKIEGSVFQNNSAIANGTSAIALGGVINNSGTITEGIINAKFLDNSAYSADYAAQGAAIYTNKNLSIIADGSVGDGISTFKGNYVQVGTGAKKYEAIRVSGAGTTLTLSAKNGGTLNLYDYVTGSAGYTTNLTGDANSKINLYNDIKNSNVVANNVKINTANSDYHQYEFYTLNSDESAKWTIDINALTKEVDTIKTTNASTGTITIDDFNIVAGDFTNITDTTYKIQILDTQDSNLQLALTDNAKAKLGGKWTISSTPGPVISDVIVANNTWATTYCTHQTITDVIGEMVLTTTNTANDSIGFSSTTNTYTIDTSIGDTLAIINQSDIEGRNFTTTNASDVYNATSNLGVMGNGTFTVSGATAGSNKSTINLADYTGFNLDNVSTLNITDVQINSNKDIITVNNSAAKVNLTDSIINGNITGASQFDLFTNGTSELNGNTSNVNLTNNGNLTNGGTISGIINNSAGGSLTTKIAGLNGTVTNNGVLNFTDGGSTLYDIQGNGDIHISTTEPTVLNNNIYGNTLNLDAGSTLILGTNKDISQGGLIVNGGSFGGVADNQINNYNFGNVTLNSNLNISGIDFNPANLTTDRFSGNFTGSGKVVIDNINLASNYTPLEYIRVDLSELTGINGSILSVKGQQLQDIMSPVKVLHGSIVNNCLTYQMGAGNSTKDFNPAVFASPVSSEIGGYLTQIQTLHEGFYHLDRYTKFTKKERLAAENANRYAIADETSVPTYQRSEVPETSKAMWIIPYTSFEKVNLRGGINVDNVTYGALYGGDTDLYDLGNDFKGVISAFIGYNGSHQSYRGISMNQQGGTIGLTGTLYKGNFFTAITASTGASMGEAHTMYGSDDFGLLTAGVASRTGYNWELAGGKLIIQPQVFLGYVFVNAFDYKNAAGVKISSDPMHTVQVAPGLKIIGNTKNGWRPYASVDVMMNFMGETKYSANNTKLPELSVKPYVQYGVGVQKSWGERFTGFLQAMLRSGGRNGIVLSAGFRWTLGGFGKKSNKEQVDNSSVNSKKVIKKVSNKRKTKSFV